MRKLILYSLVAHLIILGFLFTIPMVSERKPKPHEMYRVSFVELPGTPLQQRDGGQAVKAPEPKKIEPKKKTAAAEQKKEAVKPKPVKKAEKPTEEKKVEKPKPEKKAEKVQPEKKKEAPKPEKTAQKEPAPAPPPAKEAPAKKEPQKEEKAQPKLQEPIKGVTREEKRQEPEPAPSPKREEEEKGLKSPPKKEEEKAPGPVLKGEGKEPAEKITEESASAIASLGPKGVGKLSLENVDFPYSYYLTVMQRKIAEHWRPVYGEFERRGGKRVVVYFRVLRDGSIQDLKIEESSGDETLDRSAAKAIMEASPLPPLPYEFRGEELRVHFGFEYSQEG